MNRFALPAAVLALSSVAFASADAGGNIKLGDIVSIDATVCLTKRAALQIADTARKAGTGYATYMNLKRAGTCGDALARGKIEKIITEFEDTKIGHTTLVEINMGDEGGKPTLVYGLVGDPDEPAGQSVRCEDACSSI